MCLRPFGLYRGLKHIIEKIARQVGHLPEELEQHRLGVDYTPSSEVPGFDPGSKTCLILRNFLFSRHTNFPSFPLFESRQPSPALFLATRTDRVVFWITSLNQVYTNFPKKSRSTPQNQ